MPYSPNPTFTPGMPGVKLPLESIGEARRESFGEESETVCSIKLWERVNRRRHVCGLPPLHKTKRSAKDLAQGLLAMREFWVKGDDWNQIQPGDDPLLVLYTQKLNYPTPRTVLARISWEGVAIWRELRIPKCDLDGPTTRDVYDPWFDTHTFVTEFQPKLFSSAKDITLKERINDVEAIFEVPENHEFYQGQIVDLMWQGYPGNENHPSQGCKIEAVITEVKSTKIKIKGGRGDLYPTVDNKCFIMTDPDDTYTIHVWRHDPNPTCAGIARVLDRMKYTGTSRQLDKRQKPEIWLRTSTGRGIYGYANPIYGGNVGRTLNEWDDNEYGKLTGYYDNLDRYIGDYPAPGGSFFREPAIKWKRFNNLSTGVGVNYVMRNMVLGSGTSGEQGLVLQDLALSFDNQFATIQGLTWPGIIYGTANPEVYDTGGPSIILADYQQYWIPIQNTFITDSINATQTTIPVDSASHIPYSGYYKYKIGDEIVRVTDTQHPSTPPGSQHYIIVERGAEGTTATPHADNTPVEFIDVTFYPQLPGLIIENWTTGTTNAPWGRDFMKKYIEASIDQFALGTGPDYAETQENDFQAPVRTFTSSGVWTCPENVHNISVNCWGAGGGGGSKGGGGGGAFARKSIFSVTPGTDYNVTVGEGGAGSDSDVGGVGGDSSFSTLVKAKGGEGGCSKDIDKIASGGKASDCVGDLKYSGGRGSLEGGGGSSAGYLLQGNDAIKEDGGIPPEYGGDGGTRTVGEFPGGGGASTFSGGNGKVEVIEIFDNVSLGGAFRSYMAIHDWLAYRSINDYPLSAASSLYSIPTYLTPKDISQGNTGNRFVFGTGGGQGMDGFDHFICPHWNIEFTTTLAEYIPLSNGSGTFIVTDECILYEPSDAVRAQHRTFLTSMDALLVLSASIGNTPLVANLTMGWTNVLSEYDITAAAGVVSTEIGHDYKQRNANVTVTGSGYTDFEFTEDRYGEFNGKIKLWRRRVGTKTIRRYGEDLFTASIKNYNSWESMMWLGGLHLNSSSVNRSELVITYEDIDETSDDEVEILVHDTRLIEATSQQIAHGLPGLDEISDDVPTNYVTNLNNIQIGEIFSNSINFKDFYIPYIAYDFEDTEVGQEDNDGLLPGIKQVPQTPKETEE